MLVVPIYVNGMKELHVFGSRFLYHYRGYEFYHGLH